MGDDQHRARGAWRVEIRVKRRQHALGDLLARLAVAPAAADGLGKALRDLAVGEALPGAEVLLAQVRVDVHRQPVDERRPLPRCRVRAARSLA